MNNYKECSDTEYKEALDVMHEIKAGTVSIEFVSTGQLYIMYTKMRADHSHLSGVSGSYAMGLRISTRKIVEALETELIRRKSFPAESGRKELNMANYYATIRTNYFSVKDENAFRELMQSVSAEDQVHIFEQPQSDGSKKFGFGCYGNIYGIPVGPDEDDLDGGMDRFLDALQNLVCENDAVIMTEVGNEKLRYVIGCSTIITSKEIRGVSIPDKALHLAQELLGNKNYQNQMDY